MARTICQECSDAAKAYVDAHMGKLRHDNELQRLRIAELTAERDDANRTIATLNQENSAFSDRLAELEAENDRLKKQTGLDGIDRLHMTLGDYEQSLGQAYYLITGRSPQWSREFALREVMQEIDDAQKILRARIAFLESANADLTKKLAEAHEEAAKVCDEIERSDDPRPVRTGAAVCAAAIRDLGKQKEKS